MATLSKIQLTAIHKAVDLVFDRLKGQLLGPDWINPRKDKNIFISFKPHLSLPGVYEMAAREEAAKPNPEVLESLVHVADSYIESQRHATKAQVINAVTSFLTDAAKKSIKTDLKTVLGGELAGIYTKLQNNLTKLVSTEANAAKNLGTLEGIVRVNLLNGISDPVVAFIGPNDKEVCEECKKVLYTRYPVPKAFKLSEVKTGFHVRGEDSPSMYGIHPHCFTSSTRLHTQYGILTAEELFKIGTSLNVTVDSRIKNRKFPANQFGKEIPGSVWLDRHGAGSKILSATNVYKTGIQPCVRIETENGLILEVSYDHEVWIDDNKSGKKVRAIDVKPGDKIPTLSGEGQFGLDHFPDLAELMGNLLGDGTLNEELSGWQFFGDDIEYGNKLIELARPYTGAQLKSNMTIEPPNELYNVSQCKFTSVVIGRKLINEFGLSKTPRRVPNRIFGATKETVAAFLRGLYAADGHSQGTPSVSISQTDREFLSEIQLLLSNFGIRSGIYDHEKAHKKIFMRNGKSRIVSCKDSWRLLIGGWDQVDLFAKEIGLGVPAKQAKLIERLENTKNNKKLGAWRVVHVKSVIPIGDKQTYCLTEPMTNTVTANGLIVGQCRHTLIALMPGFGFDANGNLRHHFRGYDVLKDQRG